MKNLVKRILVKKILLGSLSVMAAWSVHSAILAEGAIKVIKAEDFKAEVLDSKIPVLVDYFAQWCGPCKRLAPILEALAKENEGTFKFVKMDEADSRKFFQEQGVSAYPTLRFFQDGAITGQVIGFNDKDKMKSLVDLFKAMPSVGMRYAGIGLIGQPDNFKASVESDATKPSFVMIGSVLPDLPLMRFSYEFNKVANVIFVVQEWNGSLAKEYGIVSNADKSEMAQGLYKFEKGKEVERLVFFKDDTKEFEKKLDDYKTQLRPLLEDAKRAEEQKKAE